MGNKKPADHLPESFGFRCDEARGFPSLILVAGASPCNLRCDGCPCTYLPSIRDTENPAGEKENYFKPEYYRKLTEECLAHSTGSFHPRLRISGYGEPILNRGLPEMIRYSCEKGVPTSLITNGLLLTPDLSERFIRMGIESIEISADAHEPELYAQMRVGGDFSVLKENVSRLIELRNELQTPRRTIIIVSVVKGPRNHEKVPEIKAFWEEMGVDNVSVRKFLTWGLPQLKKMQEKVGDETYMQGESPCPYPYERLMLDPAGWIRLCPYDDQKLIPPFGHISDTTIAEVWTGERFERIRQYHGERFNDDLARGDQALCADCEDRLNRSWTFNYFAIASRSQEME